MSCTNVFFTQLETFEPTRAPIDFTESSTRGVTVSALQPTDSPDIRVLLSVTCARLDLQVSAMTRICSVSGSMLLPVEDRTLWYPPVLRLARSSTSGVVPAL
jgi:hypothetical protein